MDKYEVVYTVKRPGVGVDVSREMVKGFQTLTAAMVFARFTSSNNQLVGKPELREVA